MSIFSVVATPIGNLDDITLRALNILREADVIFCEDTRVTKRLLERHGINVPLKSYHSHSQLSRKEEVVELLKEDKKIALVSDAGTPGISDPGVELVKYIRQELIAEITDGSVKIQSIPGPSALTAAISIAGASCADFTFLGFLPHKKGRETLFKEIAVAKRTMVFYESPHRIIKTLESLVLFLGNNSCQENLKEDLKSNKKITVCREITKIFEEVISGSTETVKEYFDNHPDKVKGEFVVIVEAI